MNVSRLSFRKLLRLNVLWFSLNAQYAALVPVVVPTQILLFVSSGQVGSVDQATLLSWLTAIASTLSLLVPPLIGHLSDQTSGPLGRRRPYILVGGLLQTGSAFFLASAETILLFLIGLSMLHIGNTVLTAAYQSLIPDQVPREQRGEASGYVGAMTILGNVVGLGLAAWLLGSITRQTFNAQMIISGARVYYLVTALIMVPGLLITLFGVHETPLQPASRRARQDDAEARTRTFARDWIEPWHSYNFTLVFLTRSCIMLGLAMFMTFIEYYFARVQHIENFVQVTAWVAVLALGGGVISGLLSGLFSDRLKRRAPLVCMSTLCMSVASLSFVIFPNHLSLWLWPLGLLFGLGYGAYMSVDWALSIDVLPSLEEAGKDLGLWGASITVPAILAPLLGSLLLNLAAGSGQTETGYRLVFTAATCFLVLAGLCVLLVRE